MRWILIQKNHNYLNGILLADKYPDGEKSMEILLGEPYFSFLERMERRVPPIPSLPTAVNLDLGWF